MFQGQCHQVIVHSNRLWMRTVCMTILDSGAGTPGRWR